jgi:sugar phosphate isomerase/epimerase
MLRRNFLHLSPAMPSFCSTLTSLGSALATPATSAGALARQAPAPTEFLLACMTLPYSAFPLDRAFRGIRQAGYDHVAWGVSHPDAQGQRRPVMPVDAPPLTARSLADRCRNEGLSPIMMFSTVNFEEQSAIDAYKRRVDQAQAAGIGKIIVFGKTTGGDYAQVIRNLQGAAQHAEGTPVQLVVKQHGGNTATGADCSRIIADVGHPSLAMCYDAGNVLDYENHDPIADIQTCWRDIRAFAIKDHRNTPADQDCGPGLGEIDHYKLLLPVMQTGLTMPLACENIFEPLVPRPQIPEGIDSLARRAREHLEAVIAGLRHHLRQRA